MKYEEFTEDIQKKLTEIVEEQYEDGTVVIRNVLKNNGVRMKAVSILRKEERATPSIYLRQYYQEYKKGRSTDSICKEIFAIYENSMNAFHANVDLTELSDFERIRKKLFYRLINYEKNQSVLKDAPHFQFLDLAIVFYMYLESDENGISSVMVHNYNLETWGKTAEEIREIALKNTWQKYPSWICDMEQLVSDMILKDLKHTMGEDKDGFLAEEGSYGAYKIEEVEQVIREEVSQLKMEKNMEMYILSNEQRLNGAACITYPGVLRNFAQEHQSDLCIIPSSIHEVILIVGTHWDLEWLNKMVKQVNKEDVDATEVLSDHVYIYSREEDDISY
ncbi:MAG: DUF5688 family protein [Eubacterium sp.]|nr:DUF5688 family protein [Eubacterium sp.]